MKKIMIKVTCISIDSIDIIQKSSNIVMKVKIRFFFLKNRLRWCKSYDFRRLFKCKILLKSSIKALMWKTFSVQEIAGLLMHHLELKQLR